MSTVECKTKFLCTELLSYVADPPRGFASCYLEKVMKRQWVSRRDTTELAIQFTIKGQIFRVH